MLTDEKIEVELATKERKFIKVYQDFLYSDLLTVEEKMIYIALKSFVRYGEDQGEVFPGMQTLCRISSLSKPRATKAIKHLTEKGIVKKKQRGLTKTNLYILMDNPMAWSAKSVEEMRESSESAIPYSSKELIEELVRRGDLPVTSIKKEPIPNATQSKKGIDPQQTASDYTTGEPENQPEEQFSFDEIKEQISYDALIHDNPRMKEDADCIAQILYDALNVERGTIRVQGQERPANVVIGQLRKVGMEQVRYVIEQYRAQTGRINSPKNYMLTLLYESVVQMRLDIENAVMHDLYSSS